MQKQQIFEYAVLYHPPRKRNAEGEATEHGRTKLIVDVTRIVAKDEAEATLLAARAIPEEYVDKLSECEVAVRPF